MLADTVIAGRRTRISVTCAAVKLSLIRCDISGSERGVLNEGPAKMRMQGCRVSGCAAAVRVRVPRFSTQVRCRIRCAGGSASMEQVRQWMCCWASDAQRRSCGACAGGGRAARDCRRGAAAVHQARGVCDSIRGELDADDRAGHSSGMSLSWSEVFVGCWVAACVTGAPDVHTEPKGAAQLSHT